MSGPGKKGISAGAARARLGRLSAAVWIQVALLAALLAGLGAYYFQFGGKAQFDRARYYNLGISATREGDTAAALKYFDAALAADPKLYEALTGKAIAYARVKRYAESETCLDRLLEAKGDDAQAWFMKGTLALLTGRQKDSEKCFEKLISIDPGYKYRVREIVNEHRNGRLTVNFY